MPEKEFDNSAMLSAAQDAIKELDKLIKDPDGSALAMLTWFEKWYHLAGYRPLGRAMKDYANSIGIRTGRSR